MPDLHFADVSDENAGAGVEPQVSTINHSTFRKPR
jgi:hypothetical protein